MATIIKYLLQKCG